LGDCLCIRVRQRDILRADRLGDAHRALFAARRCVDQKCRDTVVAKHAGGVECVSLRGLATSSAIA
jgi:hypothetical protein